MSVAGTPEGMPLLELAQARLRIADGTRTPELSASAQGRRLALVGPSGIVFRLLVGEVELCAGRATLLDMPVSAALRSGRVGVARHDPPLPMAWTPARYLTESALLLGWPRWKAIRGARDLLRRFELTHISKRPFRVLPLVERRALLIAHATLTDPEVVCLEAPLDRLDPGAQSYLEAKIERALENRAGILAFAEVSAVGRERALLERSDRVWVFAHGHIVADGPPERALAPGPRVLATVARHGPAFGAALAARGLGVSSMGRVEALLGHVALRSGSVLERFLVVLKDPLDTRGVLEAAQAAEAPLLELRPLDFLRTLSRP